MGEIKSTLDLVMERTRHLSLTAEEKETQRRETFAKRLQGLLQQYADEAVALDEVCNRIAALQTEMNITEDQAATRAVVQRVDPEQANARWMALLAHLAPHLCRPLEEMLATYKAAQAALLQSARQHLQERLAHQASISGSAVVPNPRKDPASQEKLVDLLNGTRAAIETLV